MTRWYLSAGMLSPGVAGGSATRTIYAAPGGHGSARTPGRPCSLERAQQRVDATGRDALVTQPTAKTMIRVVGGLTSGTRYTFTIAALTAYGPGAAASVAATAG